MKLKFKIVDVEKFKESIQPVSDIDFAITHKLKEGDFLSSETWKERDIRNHRRFFAFLQTFVYFLPEDEKYDHLRNIEYLRKHLMLIIGEVDEQVDLDGVIHLQAKSISFKNMDQDRFNYIYRACRDISLKHYLHWISIEEFENSFANFY